MKTMKKRTAAGCVLCSGCSPGFVPSIASWLVSGQPSSVDTWKSVQKATATLSKLASWLVHFTGMSKGSMGTPIESWYTVLVTLTVSTHHSWVRSTPMGRTYAGSMRVSSAVLHE